MQDRNPDRNASFSDSAASRDTVRQNPLDVIRSRHEALRGIVRDQQMKIVKTQSDVYGRSSYRTT